MSKTYLYLNLVLCLVSRQKKIKSLTAILLLLSLLNENSTASAFEYLISDYIDNSLP